MKKLIPIPFSITMRKGSGYVRFRINPENSNELNTSFLKLLKSHPFKTPSDTEGK